MIPFDAIKDPDADLDYGWDWSAWLSAGETIDTVVWEVADGITQHDPTKTSTSATIWLRGGTVGQSYPITCRITTNQLRTDDRTAVITVMER